MKDKKIIFDTERMKYHHTGLYHFCAHLGKELMNLSEGNDFYFYHNHKADHPFQEGAKYIDQYSYQKFIRPNFKKIDLWHSTFQLSDYIPRNSHTKVVATIHDLNFLKVGKSSDRIEKYLKKVQRNIDYADEVVAISNYVKNDIETYCNLNGKEVQVIYNGNNIDVGAYQLGTETSKTREDFIFTIGTVNRKKNMHILPYLLLGNRLRLVISGIVHEPEYEAYILEIAKNIGVADRVIMTGPITEEQKYKYLKECALFVFPSIAEGFGLPVIEAMAFGKKVLLSRYTCLPEIGGDHAYYLDSDEEDFVEDFGRNRIVDLIHSQIDESAVRNWAAQFTWKSAAQKYWNLYEKLLK